MKVREGERLLRSSMVMKDHWADADGKRVDGYRRADVVRNLAKRGEWINEVHVVACDRYLRDYEVGVMGAKLGGESAGVRPPGFSGRDVATERLAAIKRVRLVEKIIGPRLTPMLRLIVIENMTLKAWADGCGMPQQVALGRFIAILERMADYFGGV